MAVQNKDTIAALSKEIRDLCEASPELLLSDILNQILTKIQIIMTEREAEALSVSWFSMKRAECSEALTNVINESNDRISSLELHQKRIGNNYLISDRIKTLRIRSDALSLLKEFLNTVK